MFRITERNGIKWSLFYTNEHFNSYYTENNKYNDNKEMNILVVSMIELTINLTRERNENIYLHKFDNSFVWSILYAGFLSSFLFFFFFLRYHSISFFYLVEVNAMHISCNLFPSFFSQVSENWKKKRRKSKTGKKISHLGRIRKNSWEKKSEEDGKRSQRKIIFPFFSWEERERGKEKEIRYLRPSILYSITLTPPPPPPP